METLEPRWLLSTVFSSGVDSLPRKDDLPATVLPITTAAASTSPGLPSVTDSDSDSAGAAGNKEIGTVTTVPVTLFTPVIGPTSATPDALKDAQPLPTVSDLEVLDALVPGQAQVVYEIPVDPRTGMLGMELLSPSGEYSESGRLTVLDPSGNVLYDSSPGGTESSLVLSFAGDSTTHPPWQVFAEVRRLGDAANPSANPTSGSFPYILQITHEPGQWPATAAPLILGGNEAAVEASFSRETLAMVSRYLNPGPPLPESGRDPTPPTQPPRVELPGNPQGPPAPPSPSLPSPTPTPTPTGTELGPWSPPGASLTAPATPGSLPPLLIATGPLPLRSAAPLGGVLAVGDPAPPIDRHERAGAGLVALELAPGFGAIEPVLLPRKVVPVGGQMDGPNLPVVAVRGRGGFPLLVTTLLAEATAPATSLPRGDRPGDLAPAADEVATGSMACAGGSLPSLATATEPGSDAGSPCSGRTRGGRRASTVSALAIALTLAIGLVLPDLVASFQPAAPARRRLRLLPVRRGTA